MCRRLSFLFAGAVVMLVASAVSAGTLTSATWEQVIQGLPATRTFNQLGASGTSTAGSIAVNLSYPFFATTFFVPKTPNGTLDLGIQITQGGAQAITATPAMAAGTPGVPGTVVVMTAAHVNMGANQSMFKLGVNTLVAVPLSAGKAGNFTGTFTVVGALHTITVDFFAWTPATQMFVGLTSKGAALPNVTAAGSFNLDANGAGTVTLVSPSKVDIDGSLAQRRTASFTKLTLSFVPEPGWLALLLGGFPGLVLLGTFRRR